MSRSRRLIAVAIVLVATFGGCEGGSGDASSTSAPSTSMSAVTTTTLSYRTDVGAPPPSNALIVSMKDLKFLPSTLRTSTNLRIWLSNDESPCVASTCRVADSVHDLVILDGATGLPLARSDRLDPGESGLFVVDRMPKGSYRFFCALHVPASMEGTLEVEG